MRIVLARHTQTPMNLNRCYYGRMDVSINQTGLEQAQMLGRKLNELERVDTVITSRLSRTIQTADIALKETPFNPERIVTEAFNERDFGIWEGKTADQVAEIDPENWQHFLNTPFEATPRGGEKFSDFEDRILYNWDQILYNKSSSDTLLMVLHLGVIRVIIKERLETQRDFWDIQLPAGDYRIFDIN